MKMIGSGRAGPGRHSWTKCSVSLSNCFFYRLRLHGDHNPSKRLFTRVSLLGILHFPPTKTTANGSNLGSPLFLSILIAIHRTLHFLLFLLLFTFVDPIVIIVFSFFLFLFRLKKNNKARALFIWKVFVLFCFILFVLFFLSGCRKWPLGFRVF